MATRKGFCLFFLFLETSALRVFTWTARGPEMATNDERCKEGRQESAKKPKLSEEHMASYGKEVTAPCSSPSSSSSSSSPLYVVGILPALTGSNAASAVANAARDASADGSIRVTVSRGCPCGLGGAGGAILKGKQPYLSFFLSGPLTSTLLCSDGLKQRQSS